MITREKVKAHLKRHKIKYIATSTFLIGLGVGVAIHRKPMVSLNTGAQAVSGVHVVINGTQEIINKSENIITFGGHQTKIVECIETGEIFKKVRDAAKSAGVEAYNMSKHLNGKGSDKVFGKTYSISLKDLGSVGFCQTRGCIVCGLFKNREVYDD